MACWCGRNHSADSQTSQICIYKYVRTYVYGAMPQSLPLSEQGAPYTGPRGENIKGHSPFSLENTLIRR